MKPEHFISGNKNIVKSSFMYEFMLMIWTLELSLIFARHMSIRADSLIVHVLFSAFDYEIVQVLSQKFYPEENIILFQPVTGKIMITVKRMWHKVEGCIDKSLSKEVRVSHTVLMQDQWWAHLPGKDGLFWKCSPTGYTHTHTHT